jgi:uncharacterized protein YcgI (DUF1989 family)
MAVKSRRIAPGEGYAADVLDGQFLQIITVEGKQVSDFIAFNLHDPAEFLSTSVTRSRNSSIMLQKGMVLYSNRRNPMFELIEDTVGRHDILFAACDERRYLDDFGLENHANCTTAFRSALDESRFDSDRLPDPINWFMNIAILQRGELEARESLAERDDFVLLKALMDVKAGVTACPQDQTPINSEAPSDILVRVFK